ECGERKIGHMAYCSVSLMSWSITDVPEAWYFPSSLARRSASMTHRRLSLSTILCLLPVGVSVIWLTACDSSGGTGRQMGSGGSAAGSSGSGGAGGSGTSAGGATGNGGATGG